MRKSIKLILTSFILVAVLTLAFVVFFFDPISSRDISLLEVHPLIGFLVYVSICVGIFEWGNHELKNSYKAAFIVAAPQVALIIDLVLRGDRGPLSGIAGIVMLISTWAIVAANYKWLSSKFASEESEKH